MQVVDGGGVVFEEDGPVRRSGAEPRVKVISRASVLSRRPENALTRETYSSSSAHSADPHRAPGLTGRPGRVPCLRVWRGYGAVGGAV